MIDSSRIVVDTSVVVKWYVPETGSTRAADLLSGGDSLLAPDLLIAEFGNVLWKKVQRAELGFGDAQTIATAFFTTNPVRTHPLPGLFPAAFELASQYRHPIYDAFYLALAVAENCRFITADDQLVQSLRNTPITRFVQRL